MPVAWIFALQTQRTITIIHGLFQYLILWLNIHDVNWTISGQTWDEWMDGWMQPSQRKGTCFPFCTVWHPQFSCCMRQQQQLNYWFNQRINSHAQLCIRLLLLSSSSFSQHPPFMALSFSISMRCISHIFDSDGGQSDSKRLSLWFHQLTHQRAANSNSNSLHQRSLSAVSHFSKGTPDIRCICL